jgi:uncharacterized membrane protein
LAVFVIAGLVHPEPFGLALGVSAVAGVIVCGVIVLHYLKTDHPFFRGFCGRKTSASCDRVLQSRAATVVKGITLADIGLVYHLAVFLFLLTASLSGRNNEAMRILILPCSLAFAASFLSLYYQGFVVRSWCRLCLATVAISWLQEALLAGYFLNLPGAPHSPPLPGTLQGQLFPTTFQDIIQLLPMALQLIVCLIGAGGWLLTKSYVAAAGEATTAKDQLSNWKRNLSLFTVLLRQTAPIGNRLHPQDWVLGNPSGAIRITAVLSFYCAVCRKEYSRLLNLLEKYPDDLQVIIRPKNPPPKNKAQREIVFPYLLEKYFQAKDPQQKAAVLTVWYDTMDAAKCRKILGPSLQENDYSYLVREHDTWLQDNNIQQSPALFINDHLLSAPYGLADLELLIPKMRRSGWSAKIASVDMKL